MKFFHTSIETKKGLNDWEWSGTDANDNVQKPGVYIVQLQTSSGVEVVKVVKR